VNEEHRTASNISPEAYRRLDRGTVKALAADNGNDDGMSQVVRPLILS